MRCPTGPPRSVTSRPFSPTPVNGQLRDSGGPCPLGSARARDAAPRSARATHGARPFLSARVFVRPKCMHGSECTRAWVSVSVSCSDTSPAPWRGEPPSSSQPPASPDGKVSSGAGMCGRRELLHPCGPPTHPMPPASPLQLLPGSCSSAGTFSPQTRRLSARSGLRAPARSGLVERGGAAEAAPPTQGREWSAPHPNSRPRTQPRRISEVARGCPLASQLTGLIWL